MKARLPELGAMARAYDEDKKPTAYLPLKAFARGAVTPGDEVQLEDGNGNVATGRVKGLAALVEVDLSTVESKPNPNQGALITDVGPRPGESR